MFYVRQYNQFLGKTERRYYICNKLYKSLRFACGCTRPLLLAIAYNRLLSSIYLRTKIHRNPFSVLV